MITAIVECLAKILSILLVPATKSYENTGSLFLRAGRQTDDLLLCSFISCMVPKWLPRMVHVYHFDGIVEQLPLIKNNQPIKSDALVYVECFTKCIKWPFLQKTSFAQLFD